MADYGMKVWDGDGNEVIGWDDVLTRLVYMKDVPADETDSVILAYLDGKSSVQFAIPTAMYGVYFTNAEPKVTRSGNTITWTKRGTTHIPTVPSRVYVFVYD